MNLEQNLEPIALNNSQEPEIILSEEDKQKIELYKQKIDLNSTQNVIQYGLSSQNQITSFSD